jgi:hypothetical protein
MPRNRNGNMMPVIQKPVAWRGASSPLSVPSSAMSWPIPSQRPQIHEPALPARRLPGSATPSGATRSGSPRTMRRTGRSDSA